LVSEFKVPVSEIILISDSTNNFNLPKLLNMLQIKIMVRRKYERLNTKYFSKNSNQIFLDLSFKWRKIVLQFAWFVVTVSFHVIIFKRRVVIRRLRFPIVDRNFGLVLFSDENHKKYDDSYNGNGCHNGKSHQGSVVT